MKQEELKRLSNEELQKKEKSTKTLIGLFIPIILALIYFEVTDYINGDKINMPISVITICSIGGMILLFPELRSIQKELRSRKD